jgi:hypothetical protein
MALARVVSFGGVGQARVEEMKQRIDQGPPDDIPAKEIVMLYDAELSAMPADEALGQRTSVGRYEVVARAIAQGS